jgi:hypothetical protein
MSDHELIVLKANSPHIGEKCPIRHKSFQSGDTVVSCQKHNTLISKKSLAFLDGYCPICGDNVNLPLSSQAKSPGSGAKVRAPNTQAKPRYPTPTSRRPATNRIMTLLAILFVGISLGALGIWTVTGQGGNDAKPTPIGVNHSVTTEGNPTVPPTPRPTSKPNPTSKPTATRKPTPTSKPQPTNTPRVSRTEIEDLLDRWDAAHHKADRYWDTSQLDTVLYGDVLNQQIATVNLLEDRNCYWAIRDVTEPRISRFDIINSNKLIVEVDKNWDMDMYCNGKKSGDDDGPFTMRYDIERIRGRWYITRKQVISN